MKKKFFVGLSLLAATGLWTGCSNDDIEVAPGNKQAISFHVQGGAPELRATGTEAKHVDAFVVYGTDNSNDFGKNGKFIFDGITVARVAGGTSFDYSPKRFYGDKATESVFYAYSPVNVTENGLTKVPDPAVSNSAISAKYSYVLPKPDATSSSTTQQDLLFAGEKFNSLPSGDHPVTLNFKHVLSRIFVTATNATTAEDGNVTVKKLSLVGLKTTADIAFTNASATWTWENFSNVQELAYVLADGGVLVPSRTSATKTNLTSREQGMMIIPQKTVNQNDATIYDAGDFALKVEYDLGNLKNQTKYILLADEYQFAQGKQYAINIEFKGNMISFSIAVADWESPVVAIP